MRLVSNRTLFVVNYLITILSYFEAEVVIIGLEFCILLNSIRAVVVELNSFSDLVNKVPGEGIIGSNGEPCRTNSISCRPRETFVISFLCHGFVLFPWSTIIR